MKTTQVNSIDNNLYAEDFNMPPLDEWSSIEDQLNGRGFCVIKSLMTSDACQNLISKYSDNEKFRKRVVMERHGFGSGEYKYFGSPLTTGIVHLRAELYKRLAPIANRWNSALGIKQTFPVSHADFLSQCHENGQNLPTPLLLKYQTNDFNCLHQDLYGDYVFPLQIVILLSQPEVDFTGGEFVITEQRPRMQSKVEVVHFQKGDAVVFAVHNRPVNGTRGVYKVNLRHGVSRVSSGNRYAFGIILHDAMN
ncbi:hypothetical protein SAMN05192566_1974 [Methylophilus rhizosphaerae]|uniref:Fe2OG dioxygenase domain-containing protein n=1 Tax=Methylophilus rhizosphaerae TaxID=492660 RepID=A0A1G9DTR3_9PROT|nr:2OG-Fe(II) oxygenase [Methylophilus rhizosphaerae]SDK67271.1 hypothetical protein SAMN05192566_1974 [Methylophilus rhizosphaerae]